MLIRPAEVFEACEGLPLAIKLLKVLHLDSRIPEPWVFSKLDFTSSFLVILLVQLGPLIGFPLLLFDEFKHFSINRIEISSLIGELLETPPRHVLSDVKTESLHVKLLLCHLMLVVQHLLFVIIVPRPLIDVREYFVGLLHFHKLLLGIRIWRLVRMELKDQLLVTALDLSEGRSLCDTQDLVIAAFACFGRLLHTVDVLNIINEHSRG